MKQHIVDTEESQVIPRLPTRTQDNDEHSKKTREKKTQKLSYACYKRYIRTMVANQEGPATVANLKQPGSRKVEPPVTR